MTPLRLWKSCLMILRWLENFCQAWKVSSVLSKGIQIRSIPELRWNLFCKHTSEWQVTTYSWCLKQHTLRVHVQARVWVQASTSASSAGPSAKQLLQGRWRPAVPTSTEFYTTWNHHWGGEMPVQGWLFLTKVFLQVKEPAEHRAVPVHHTAWKWRGNCLWKPWFRWWVMSRFGPIPF